MAVGVLGEVLMTLGVLIGLFLVWQLWWTDVSANRVQDQRASELVEEFESAPPQPVPSGEPIAVEPWVAPPNGRSFALLHVPRFGEDYLEPITEGVTLDVLNEYGPGHYPGTAGPGEVGNFALAAHRTTYGKPFNKIAELETGDAVVVEVPTGWYTYRVTEHLVVDPRDVEVVDPVPGLPGEAPTARMLTMTACHPMFSARQRYVVHAELEDFTDRAEGSPAALTTGA